MIRSRLLLLAVLAVLLVAAGCGGDDEGKTQSAPDKAPSAQTSSGEAGAEGASTNCPEAEAPKPKPAPKLSRPKSKLDAKRDYRARFETSCGNFVIALDVKNSPKTAASVAALIKRGLYDNTIFHRIVPGFVIQGGDPLGNGSGGPGYKVTERPPADAKYTRGTVAMAKAGDEPPGTSGSQFFVVTGEDISTQLGSPDYAILGKVVEGQEVVDRLGVQPAQPDPPGTPMAPLVVRKVTLIEG